MKHLNENKTVGQLSEIIALSRGYSPEKARMIRNAATLHDIGKQKISHSILTKKDRLSEHEREVIKTHTWMGAEMMASIQGELGEMTRLCCLLHHEWHNGGGYWKIPACFLPEYISFVAIADVFTALVVERPYKSAWPPEEALAFIQSRADTQFCPVLVEDFIRLIRTDSRVAAIFLEV